MKSLITTGVSTLFLSVALLGACDDNNDDRVIDDVDSIAPSPIPASDVDYIDSLIPHHDMALRMADAVLAGGADPEVREMARMMKEVQAAEIGELQAIRADVAEDVALRRVVDPHAEADVAEIDAAAGIEADRRFLENMIPHHAVAVSMSHRALDQLTDPRLREMAMRTIDMQTREMNKMLDKLEQL